MGYYGGMGARKVASIIPSAQLPQTQPACVTDAATALYDCGNWNVSAYWNVPSTATSGIYFAHLIRDDTGGDSHIVFIVRNDSSTSPMLFQTSDETWQAYNNYGGNSLYGGATGEDNTNLSVRAFKVSYNRPNTLRGWDSITWLFDAEYPMVRWLEANGYDVSYFTGVDAARNGLLIQKHKLYLSVGHDEYWSGPQRTNVEAAIAAGVNVAFLSGNEVFWKTRWESSIDGSNTDYRTMVCYKETLANAKTDPSPEWTGTWRDPRFSPPADGGKPENALTGTSFMVNGLSMQAIQVPYTYAKLRLWRNTPVATLAAGQTASFPVGTLGFEWDVDADNGFRPAGQIDLSSATYDITSRYLLDYGGVYGDGVATHALTMHRASSGALVFGAGTVRWSWGLDSNHDNDFVSTDITMQQATANLFADMGVQPGTLQSGLFAATASTDHIGPTSTIVSPTPATTITVGSPITISGTASDSGGGVVAGVEVSTDSGQTWHPAIGIESWSYTWRPLTSGPTSIEVRATDDSVNTQSSVTVLNLNVPPSSTDNMWGWTSVPQIPDGGDTSATELGMKFRSDVAGTVTGVRFYKATTNTGTHIGHLWTSTGTLLGTVTFTNETASGWQLANFATPITIAANTTYVVSYSAPNGHYSYSGNFFTSAGVDNIPLHALQSGVDGLNGVFQDSTSAFPTQSWNDSNYWVDAAFALGSSSQTPPTISNVTATPGSGGTATISWTTNVATTTKVDYGTSSTSLSLSASSSTLSTSHSITLTGLTQGTTYYYRVTSVDAQSNTASSPVAPATSNFTENVVSVWSPASTPGNVDGGDTSALEIGMKFRSDVAGTVTGVRFYKATTNTGTHIGNLWTSTGTLLGTVTFTNEAASGWQQANFATPIAIAANTTYIVSYYAPNGHYSYNGNFFTSAGVDNTPLHALQSGVDGLNGIYQHASASAFPTQNSNDSNYWVDVAFTAGSSSQTPPTISNVSVTFGPGGTATINWATNVATTAKVDYGTSSTSLSLSASSSTLSTSHSITLTGLTQGTTYYYRVTSVDAQSNTASSPVAPATSNFTENVVSVWSPASTPGNVDGGDTSALEIGMKFRSDVAGTVTGVRFYKATANTGTHVGNLWTSTGTLLGTVTFTNETASGWQQANFATPIAIAANTTYIVSYYAPNGHYSYNGNFFTSAGVDNTPLHALQSGVDSLNGIYQYASASAFPTQNWNDSNYWVDVAFASTQ